MKISYKLEKQLDLRIRYNDKSNEAQLKTLKETNRLETLIDQKNPDFQNIMEVRSWVSLKWEQDAKIFNKSNNIRTIFNKSEKGPGNRGLEYILMIKSCLRSLGFTIRTLFIESKDGEELKKGAKHVLLEAYLRDKKKWFLIDPKFDIIIKKNGVPLNAIEFQQALVNEEELDVINPSGRINSEDYLEWVGPYLFFFTISLNKGAVNICDGIYGNKKRLTLVPINEEPPLDFKNSMRIRTSLITHSIADFYPEL